MESGREAAFHRRQQMPNEPRTSATHQGGDVSEVQTREEAQREARAFEDEDTAVKGVSGQESGAKRSSFFKDRDYRS